MPARAVCRIDLEALAHNLGLVRERVGPTVRVCGVVKANAYGHGAVPVARQLERGGAHALAVTNLDEARELSDAGISLPILILSGISPEEAPEAARRGVAPVVWDPATLRQLAAALPAGARLGVHLKMETGMRRLGALDPAALARAALELPVQVEGILSHLACADDEDHPSLGEQLLRFEETLEASAEAGLEPRLKHLANSAGILTAPRAYFDMVRPGLLLYGCVPGPHLGTDMGFRPVMELRTHVLQVKSTPAGSGVGYGWTYQTQRESRLAVLPIGYGQGYPRALSNRAEVSIRGRRVPVVGAVSMDHLTIDVTDIDGVAAGDSVTLWGGATGPDVMDLAREAGTIGYELLTRIGREVPRVYEGT